MRGGKRDGAGRPTGSTKDGTKDVQVSFRCEPEFKKRIIHTAKLAGFQKYQKWLRALVASNILRMP